MDCNENSVNKIDLEELKKSFNYEHFTQLQLDVINESYENLIISTIPGSGKTFSFLLKILQNNKKSLIIETSRELALQVHANYLEKIREKYSFLNNSLIIKDNNVKPTGRIIIGTLGTIANISRKNKKQFKSINTFVFDEFDKLIQQNKYGDLDKLLDLIKSSNSKSKSIILCSSTYSNEDLKYFCEKLDIQSFKIMGNSHSIKIDNFKNLENFQNSSEINVDELDKKTSNNFNLSSDVNCYDNIKKTNQNIMHFFKLIKKSNNMHIIEEKLNYTFNILTSLKYNKCLIFYNSKQSGEDISLELFQNGISCSFINGDLDSIARKEIYDNFNSNVCKVLVTTDLLSRGIDISKIEIIINFDCPRTIDDYIHRSGRTARFNKKGICINLMSNEDEYKLIINNLNKNYCVFLDKNDSLSIDLQKIEKELYSILTNNESIKDDYSLLNIKNESNNVEFEKFSNFPKNTENCESIFNNQNNYQPCNTTTDDKFLMLNKKRRERQFNNESKIGNWVDIDHKLYDLNKFKYFDEKKGNLKNSEELKGNQNNLKNKFINDNKTKNDASDNCVFERRNSNLRSEITNKDKFCLYCDFLSILENYL